MTRNPSDPPLDPHGSIDRGTAVSCVREASKNILVFSLGGESMIVHFVSIIEPSTMMVKY